MSLVKIKRVFFKFCFAYFQYTVNNGVIFTLTNIVHEEQINGLIKKTNREKHGKVKHKDVATRINLLRISDRFGAIRVIFCWKAPNKNV